MKRIILTLSLLLFTAAGYFAVGQYEARPDTTPENVLLEKQWSLGALLHSNGWGLKFRKGQNITALKQFMWEIEFSTYKSSKEVRSINPYFSDSRSYFYGKLNYVWFLRGGVGQQRILNRKPYWGGVQLSWLYYGGFSLGITKPVYLYIIHFNSGFTDYEVKEEKYDPATDFVDNIYGRGSFLAGFTKIGLHPGAYIKTGLDFEFGTKNRQINALEVGGIFDYSPIPIAIMAYNPEQSFFLTLYVSVMFGKRYNK
ncbi:MAG: hypothetical protein NT040_12765 [Bacteroidetes bacterium]|nr:hypothetical protein [Bacteroidota bacterium]